MITALLVGGLVVFTGLGFYVSYLQSKDVDSIKKAIKDGEENIVRLDSLISDYENFLNQIDTTSRSLADARNDFTDGGYVLDDVPLANDEFVACLQDLHDARTNVYNILNEYKTTRDDLNVELGKLRTHLNEVIAEINEKLKKEGKM